MLFSALVLGAVIAVVVAFTSQAARPNRPALLGLSVVLFIASFSQCITVIPAGHVGVIDVFGRVPDLTLKSGINLRNPFARIAKLSIKTQEMKETMNVPSKEGLNVNLEVSALFHLSPEKASDVYRTVGSNYVEVILVPQFRSVARGVTASFQAKALYTSEREVLATTIQEALTNAVEDRGIVIENTPLRNIGLPQRLTQAIEQKLEAEQESQRMQFILQKEKQEAERKRIEAKGISDFQKIVSKGISRELLKWKGIEATEKLAESQNAKVVIMGSGENGLPVILSADK